MSLVFFDGFDSVSSVSELTAINPALSSTSGTLYTTGGRFNGGRWYCNAGNGNLTYNFTPGVTEFWQGYAIRFEYLGGAGMFMYFNSAAGTEMSIGIDSAKTLYVWRGFDTNLITTNTATFVGATGDSSGPYFWVETRYKLGNNNNGAFEVWVNGVQKINLNNINTVSNSAQTAITAIGHWCHAGSSGTIPSVDDWYIVNVDSTTPNTKLGDIRIARIDPNTDFITSGTATPGPTYYTGVDDGATANTSDYITFNNTPGENVAFGVTALPSNATSIYGLSVVTQQSKSDAGSANGRHIVISNGTQSNGNVFALTTTNIKTKTYFPTDPYTSAGWTNTAVANVKIGFGVDA